MWLKVALLTLWLLSLFFISRILEATLFLESGFWSTTILDPVSMSVRQLKRILETRGICYSGVLEKQELSALVESSGQVVDGELRDSLFDELATGEVEVAVTSADPSTRFTCGSHFYEDVEDTKDSAWLIQVVPEGRDAPLLDDLNWRLLVAKVRPFGIRTGWLDCHLDKRLCRQKGWHRSQVVLALPRGNRAKDSVVFRSIGGAVRTEAAVTHWLREQLNSRVRPIGSSDVLERGWLQYGDREQPSDHHKVRVVMLANGTAEPPLFFSALSMKFAGRASFGMADADLLDHPAGHKQPTFLVVTPEGVLVYGERPGEHLNFRSFEFFLRTLQPEMNDLFLATLGLANLLALLDLVVVQSGGPWRHLARLSWTVAKYNAVLFLAWLSVFGLGRFQVMEAASEQLLRLARAAATNPLVALWWQDVRFWRSAPLALLASGLMTCVLHAYLRRRWFKVDDHQAAAGDVTNDGQERPASPTPPTPTSSFSLDSYIMNCFFRPIAATLDGQADVDLTEFLLIEHLVTPNLWLRPVVSNSSYIEDLPVWRYRCPTRNEDCGADVQTSPRHRRHRRDDADEGDDDDDDDDDYLSSCTSDGGSTSATERVVKNTCTRGASCSAFDHEHPCLHPGTTWERLSAAVMGRFSAMARLCRRAWNVVVHRRLSSSRRGSGSRRITNRVPDGVIVTHVCAICLEPYLHGDVLCGLPCGHNYHHSCILGWLVRDNHHCPICRWPSYKRRPVSARPTEVGASGSVVG